MIPLLLGAAAIVGSWRIEDANNYMRETNEINKEIVSVVCRAMSSVESAYNDNLYNIQRTRYQRDIIDKVNALIRKAKKLLDECGVEYTDEASFTGINIASGVATKLIGLSSSMVSNAMGPIKLIYGYSKCDDAWATLCDAKERLEKAKLYQEECRNMVNRLNAI